MTLFNITNFCFLHAIVSDPFLIFEYFSFILLEFFEKEVNKSLGKLQSFEREKSKPNPSVNIYSGIARFLSPGAK